MGQAYGRAAERQLNDTGGILAPALAELQAQAAALVAGHLNCRVASREHHCAVFEACRDTTQIRDIHAGRHENGALGVVSQLRAGVACREKLRGLNLDDATGRVDRKSVRLLVNGRAVHEA